MTGRELLESIGEEGDRVSIYLETFILTSGMTVCCLLPLFLKFNQTKLRRLFLVGTGAMFGLCVFDLIPDVFELGGALGILVTIGVGLLYSIAHLRQLSGHRHPEGQHHEIHDHLHGHVEGQSDSTGFLPFFLSLSGHCLASGMLLAVARDHSIRMGATVFMALIAHKGYESLTFTSILLTKQPGRRKNLTSIAIYVSALPIGVALTGLFGANLDQMLALWISAIALGSLLGCLVFDFLAPSLRHLKVHRLDLIWLMSGLIFTQWIIHLI